MGDNSLQRVTGGDSNLAVQDETITLEILPLERKPQATFNSQNLDRFIPLVIQYWRVIFFATVLSMTAAVAVLMIRDPIYQVQVLTS
jgi:uncharacterized protein involved in exopolysaccharide biosynthesis